MIGLCNDCIYRLIKCKGSKSLEKLNCDYYRQHPRIFIEKVDKIVKDLAEENIYLRKAYEDLTEEAIKYKSGHWVPLEFDGFADGAPVWDVWECSECGNEIRTEEPPKFCCDCGCRNTIKYI